MHFVELIVLLLGIAALLIASGVQRRIRWLRAVASRAAISYVTVLLLLGTGEIYFRYFFAESENLITLACLNWLDRYWQTNSLDYRDREWTTEDLVGRQVVLVTGDSFAAGWGINNPEDRFSNVLAAHLGDDYAVVNVAVYGTSTPEQLEIVRNFPLAQPDVIVLQYYLNDINYAGLRLGLLPELTPTSPLVRESYLANFVYWRFLRRGLADDPLSNSYWEWSYNAYDRQDIWGIHRQEIIDFVDYTREIDARLIVVIFPNMLDPVRSVAYVDRVAMVFEDLGVTEVLRLYGDVAAWDRADVVVSVRDSHPSVGFHHHVGDLLYMRFFGESTQSTAGH